MDLFETYCFALNFDNNAAHEAPLSVNEDEDAASREFFALNLAFN